MAAVHADDRLPADLAPWRVIDREFFGPGVTWWGSPGGFEARYRTEQDHPAVAGWPACANDS